MSTPSVIGHPPLPLLLISPPTPAQPANDNLLPRPPELQALHCKPRTHQEWIFPSVSLLPALPELPASTASLTLQGPDGELPAGLLGVPEQAVEGALQALPRSEVARKLTEVRAALCVCVCVCVCVCTQPATQQSGAQAHIGLRSPSVCVCHCVHPTCHAA